MILAIAFAAVDEPQGDPPARRRRGLRAAGVDRLAGALHELGPRRNPDACPAASPTCSAMPNKGTEFLFGPSASQPARPQLRDRGAAGDHLLREPGRDPLLSRHHAADRPLGRRRDRLGHRHQPRRIACRAAANIFVGQSELPLVVSALPRRASAFAAVHRDVRRHGRRRRHDPRRLREPARRRAICHISSPPPSCPRRAAS